jgi:hypothetical protein
MDLADLVYDITDKFARVDESRIPNPDDDPLPEPSIHDDEVGQGDHREDSRGAESH